LPSVSNALNSKVLRETAVVRGSLRGQLASGVQFLQEKRSIAARPRNAIAHRFQAAWKLFQEVFKTLLTLAQRFDFKPLEHSVHPAAFG
jgi:hypothetical protein